MEPLRQHARPSGLVILLVLVALGCAHTPPSPLSEATQAQLGTIGVVAVRTPPAVEYRTPGQGGAGGAAIGAVKGLGLGTLGAAGCLLTIGRAVAACVVAVATPYFTVRYAVDQASEGVSPDEVAASETAIRTVLTGATVQGDLPDAILRVAGAQPALVFVRLPDEAGTLQPAQARPYQDLAHQGIGTVLEITVERLTLQPGKATESGSLWSISAADLNPALTLVAAARIRVVTVAEGTELYTASLEHQGRVATFTEWGVDDAHLLREGLGQLTENLAGEILRQVFNVSVPPAPEPAAPTAPDSGQGVVLPEYSYSYDQAPTPGPHAATRS
jgi:hypothetical protein